LKSQQCVFIVNYLLLFVLMKFWCKLSEDGDNAETCRSEEMKNTLTLELFILWCYQSFNISERTE